MFRHLLRYKADGLNGDWAARLKLIDGVVYPALARQITAFADSTQSCARCGVHRLPNCEAYYDFAAPRTTTTLRERSTRLDWRRMQRSRRRSKPILISQGLTKGTVGERVVA